MGGHTFVSRGCGCIVDISPGGSFLAFLFLFAAGLLEHSSVAISLFMFWLLGLGRIHPSLDSSSLMDSYILK